MGVGIANDWPPIRVLKQTAGAAAVSPVHPIGEEAERKLALQARGAGRRIGLEPALALGRHQEPHRDAPQELGLARRPSSRS